MVRHPFTHDGVGERARGTEDVPVWPVAVCLIATGVLVAAERTEVQVVRVLAKATAATAFVWAGVVWGGLASGYGMMVLAGLVLCWLGDLLLLPSGQSAWFRLGIAAFGLGHVAYAIAFASLGLDPLAVLVALAAVGFAAYRVLAWLRPHVPDGLRNPVIGYVCVISLMLAAAVGAAFDGGPPFVALGAIGFAASDLSVARDRFVAPGFVNGDWGLPAYFASQLMIASSIASASGGFR